MGQHQIEAPMELASEASFLAVKIEQRDAAFGRDG
jgi:hypothetical protein